MPSKLALGVREKVAVRKLGALEGVPPPPSNASLPPPPFPTSWELGQCEGSCCCTDGTHGPLCGRPPQPFPLPARPRPGGFVAGPGSFVFVVSNVQSNRSSMTAQPPSAGPQPPSRSPKHTSPFPEVPTGGFGPCCRVGLWCGVAWRGACAVCRVPWGVCRVPCAVCRVWRLACGV